MNLAEALAHVANMTDDDKAAWDKANGFATEARRDDRARRLLLSCDDIDAPWISAVDDVGLLVAARNAAHNLVEDLDEIAGVLRVWPGSTDRNAQPEWLDPA